MNGLSRDAPMAEIVVLIALEIVTGGGMEEIGPALGAPGVDEAGSAGVFLEPLRLKRGAHKPRRRE